MYEIVWMRLCVRECGWDCVYENVCMRLYVWDLESVYEIVCMRLRLCVCTLTHSLNHSIIRTTWSVHITSQIFWLHLWVQNMYLLYPLWNYTWYILWWSKHVNTCCVLLGLQQSPVYPPSCAGNRQAYHMCKPIVCSVISF